MSAGSVRDRVGFILKERLRQPPVDNGRTKGARGTLPLEAAAGADDVEDEEDGAVEFPVTVEADLKYQ